MTRVCSVDGCQRAYRARGYCATHWSRWRKGMPLDTPVRAFQPDLCIEDGCARKPLARGLCTNHWYSLGECSMSDCNKRRYGHGLCRAHWKRKYRLLPHAKAAERAYVERTRDRINAQGRRRRHNEEHRAYAREQSRLRRDSGRMNLDRKREQDRSYRQRNAAAKSAADRRWRASRMAIPVSRIGPWSADEDLIASRTDLTVTEIAYLLGRSYEAVHGRRRRLRKKEQAA